jgi:hypothetical protein
MQMTADEVASREDFIEVSSNELGDVFDKRDQLLRPLFVLRIFAETEQGSQGCRRMLVNSHR